MARNKILEMYRADTLVSDDDCTCQIEGRKEKHICCGKPCNYKARTRRVKEAFFAGTLKTNRFLEQSLKERYNG